MTLAPRRAEGWTELGLLYGRINDFASAEASLRRSLQLNPDQAEAHYLLGLTLIANPREKMDWPAAIQEFRQAIRLNANYTDAIDHLGIGLLALGRVDEAVSVLKRAVAVTPGRSGPHFDLGQALENEGDPAAAEAQYRLALETKPNYSEAASALGKVLFARNQMNEAEVRLRDALRINPDLQDAHYALGRVLRKQKKSEQAQYEFQQALALDQRVPKRIESSQLSNGALAKAAKGDFAGAEADLRKAIRLRPDYGVPHYNLGLILADEQRMKEAAQQLSIAISLLPGRTQLWTDLAKVQSHLGDMAGALRSITLALELAPGNEAAEGEAKALGYAKPEEVTASNPNATSINSLLLLSDIVTSHTELASRLQAEGDWVDSSGEWLRVLALEPAGQTPRLELARCLEHMNQSGDAILEERKVLLVNPNNVEAHIALGMSLAASGSTEEARDELRQALLLDPASAPARSALEQLPRDKS